MSFLKELIKIKVIKKLQILSIVTVKIKLE